MRKIITAILSTIIIGSAFSPGASAMFVEQDTNWWSFDEILNYYYQIEVQQENECHGDFECNMRFEEEHYENDEKYRAMHSLPEQQFLLTAVNPAEETIKVFLFGQDMMLKRMGIEENLSPDSLYVSWLETWPTWGYAGRTMFDKNTATDGAGWLPVNTEVELSVAGSNLIENPTGRLGYSIFAGPFNAQGTFDYSSCLTDPDYYVGAECRLTFSGEQGSRYFPPKASLPADNSTFLADVDEGAENTSGSGGGAAVDPAVDSTSNPVTDPTVGPGEDASGAAIPGNDDRFGSHAAVAVAAASSAEQGNQNNTVEQETIKSVERELKAPETGTPTKEVENGFIFPWWLSMFLGLNVAILVWLFWPEADEKSIK